MTSFVSSIDTAPNVENFITMAMVLIDRTNKRRFSRKRMNRIFRSFFGTTPSVCVELWWRLDPSRSFEVKGARPIHLLWTLLFMKGYDIEEKNAAWVGLSEETF